MNSLKSEIVGLFESDEMKSCINSEFDSLSILTKADIIKGARADIRRKLMLLERLYNSNDKKDDFEGKKLRSDIYEFERAVGHFCKIHGDVYIVGEYGFDDDINDEKLYGYSPYTSLRKALHYIQSEWEDAKKSYSDVPEPTFWYTIEKYSPDDNGEMHEQIRWFVTHDGAVTGFNGACHTADINVPHPFCEGDIVLIDSTPSYHWRIGLIIETRPDSNDCCFPQVLCLSKDGKFITGALKHSSVFIKDFSHSPLFSPMYRLKRYQGALPENMKILKKFSDALKSGSASDTRPSLGDILWENIYNTDKTGDGVTEKELGDILERSLKAWSLKEYSG